MKIIRDLSEAISDEISDIKKYARWAADLKADHPNLAQVLYNISTQEDAHQAALHNEVVKLIEEHRRTHGDPPPAMKALYEHEHQKHIDDLAEARMYQDVYKRA